MIDWGDLDIDGRRICVQDYALILVNPKTEIYSFSRSVTTTLAGISEMGFAVRDIVLIITS